MWPPKIAPLQRGFHQRDRVDRSLYNGSSLHRLGMGPRQGTVPGGCSGDGRPISVSICLLGTDVSRVVAIPARQASAALGNSGARATAATQQSLPPYEIGHSQGSDGELRFLLTVVRS